MAEDTLVIRGGTIVTVDGNDTIIDRGEIVVRDGVIVTVSTGPLDPPAGARVIDASRCAVLPGFVNCHMHECLERGVFEDLPFMVWLDEYALPKDRAYEPRHMRASALMNQAEMIANGTTSFIDIFRFPDEAARVAVQSGLRATFSPQVIESDAAAGESMAANEAFVDAWRGRHARIRPWFGPHSLYTVTEATYQRMRMLADRYGVGIHTHLAESRAETAIVAGRTGGLSPTQWLDRLVGLGPDVVAAHCVELSAADIERIAQSGMGVAHCPTSNAKLGNGVAPIAALVAAGACVGLGTDSVMTNNNLDPFEEMRMAALVAKQAAADPTVLRAAQVLRMATIGSATVLGLNALVGSIEVGKRADLVVVDMRRPHAWPLLTEGGGNMVEQLVWSCNGSDVKATVCDGRVLYEAGHHLTLDLAEVFDLVQAETRDLLAKAGVLHKIKVKIKS